MNSIPAASLDEVIAKMDKIQQSVDSNYEIKTSVDVFSDVPYLEFYNTVLRLDAWGKTEILLAPPRVNLDMWPEALKEFLPVLPR